MTVFDTEPPVLQHTQPDLADTHTTSSLSKWPQSEPKATQLKSSSKLPLPIGYKMTSAQPVLNDQVANETKKPHIKRTNPATF